MIEPPKKANGEMSSSPVKAETNEQRVQEIAASDASSNDDLKDGFNSDSSSSSDSDSLGLFTSLRHGKRKAEDSGADDQNQEFKEVFDNLKDTRILGKYRKKKKKLKHYELKQVKVKVDMTYTALPCTLEATESSGPRQFIPHRSAALPKDMVEKIPERSPGVFKFDGSDDNDEPDYQEAYKQVYRRKPREKRPRKPAKGKEAPKGKGKGKEKSAVNMEVKPNTPVIVAVSKKSGRVSKPKKKEQAKKPAKATKTTEATKTPRAKPLPKKWQPQKPKLLVIPKEKLFEDVTKPGFFTLPPEIRELVYGWLLISNKPIHVYDGWRTVYGRQNINLCSTVLRVHSIIFKEASCVLYGKNQFRYRLRDPKNNNGLDPSIGIDDSKAGEYDDEVDDEDYNGDDDDDDDEEYQEPTRPQNKRKPRTQKRTQADGKDINIGRYIGLIRHIAVEAESNRADERTKEIMECALKVFTPTEHRKKLGQPARLLPSLGPRLHSVTVRVAPTKTAPTFETFFDEPVNYTFVDFFTPDSRVVKMLDLIQCKKLYINMVRPDKVKGARMKAKNKITTTGLDLQLNMETVSSISEQDDIWKHDKPIRLQRLRQQKNRSYQLQNLDKTVYKLLCQNDELLQKQNEAKEQAYASYNMEYFLEAISGDNGEQGHW